MNRIPTKFKLPFSQGSTWITEWIEKQRTFQNPSCCMQVKGKLYKEIGSLGQIIKKKGLPNHLALAFVHPTIETGVFLKPTAKPLEKGELVGVYTGHYDLVCDGDSPNGAYSYEIAEDITLSAKEKKRLIDPLDLQALKKKGRAYTIYTNALTMGNFTRFINHSSSSPNIEAVHCRFPCGRVEIVLFTKKKILPGEQLLSSYGSEYWLALGIIPNDITPSTYLLNKQGKAILTNPIPPLSPNVLKKLLLLRKIDTLIDEKTSKKQLLKKLPPFPDSLEQKKELFSQIIQERGLPTGYTLTEDGDVYLDKTLKKGTFIGCLAGKCFCEEKKGSMLIAAKGKTKIFLSNKTNPNFLNALPKKKDGNVLIKPFYDKEKKELILGAFAAKNIQKLTPLSLMHPIFEAL